MTPVAMLVRLTFMAGVASRAPTALQTRGKSWQSFAGGRSAPGTLDRVATRILIVEDEASIAQPFARSLQREGFETAIAGTAAEALRSARAEPPDLVILDLALPMARAVTSAARCAPVAVPVIMLTARGTETDRVVGLELGADDYVVSRSPPPR